GVGKNNLSGGAAVALSRMSGRMDELGRRQFSPSQRQRDLPPGRQDLPRFRPLGQDSPQLHAHAPLSLHLAQRAAGPPQLPPRGFQLGPFQRRTPASRRTPSRRRWTSAAPFGPPSARATASPFFVCVFSR